MKGRLLEGDVSSSFSSTQYGICFVGLEEMYQLNHLLMRADLQINSNTGVGGASQNQELFITSLLRAHLYQVKGFVVSMPEVFVKAHVLTAFNRSGNKKL